MEDVRGITIRFPKDLHAKLRHRSVDSGVSVNQMVLDGYCGVSRTRGRA